MATQNRNYRITISAVLARSAAGVMGDLVAQSERAKAKIAADAKAAQAAMVAAAKAGADAMARSAEAGAARIAAADAKAAASAQKLAVARQVAAAASAKKESEEAGKAFDQKLRLAQREQRELERFVRRQEELHKRETEAATKAAERSSAAAGGRRTQFAKDVASGALSNMGRVASGALGIGREITSGLGINFDLGSSISKGVRLESLATNISNAAFKPGQAESTRESATGLQDIARNMADKYRLDAEKVLTGLGAFQEKTGQLDVGKAGLEDFTRLAKASNTQLDDMISAAGDVANVIGDVGKEFKSPEEKARAVVNVMKSIAAQGQEGAVEIKSLATQMAKLAAASGMFEGDAGENVKKMGTLVQLSRQLGGAASATQAATSVVAFTNTLRTPARRGEFKAAGVDIDSKTTGLLKDPIQIIKDSLMATGGDLEKMKKLFANVLGDKPVTALAMAFNRAGGGQKGLDAVEAQVARFSGTMTEGQIQGNLAKSMETRESKAQLFQNQLDRIAASLADRVLPQMEKLGPKILEVVDALSKVLGWAAENPGSAVTAAIVGSIAKAAIGTAVSSSLQGLLQKAMTGGLGGAMGGLGKLGTAGLAISVAAASFMITTAVIDILSEASSKGVNQSVDRDAATLNALSAARSATKGEGADPAAAMRQLQEQKSKLEADIKAAQDPTSVIEALFTSKTFTQRGKETNDAAKLPDLKNDLAAVAAALKSLDGTLGKGLKVTPTGGPTVGSDGRAGVPDQ